ncbi:hypothetical protein HS088_TW21G00421 [Tripterygium wilfordii]|uniref:Uncharacterized protein n=1 Tax=Tripterygium wilfordii TaxID=458696 RepID=A0A7J7C3D9_TRIWF|nr:hypothetical protein HS088_TW21G00421 [Tripterygium wilfordii]
MPRHPVLRRSKITSVTTCCKQARWNPTNNGGCRCPGVFGYEERIGLANRTKQNNLPNSEQQIMEVKPRQGEKQNTITRHIVLQNQQNQSSPEQVQSNPHHLPA